MYDMIGGTEQEQVVTLQVRTSFYETFVVVKVVSLTFVDVHGHFAFLTLFHRQPEILKNGNSTLHKLVLKSFRKFL